jgi:hypothetical protein
MKIKTGFPKSTQKNMILLTVLLSLSSCLQETGADNTATQKSTISLSSLAVTAPISDIPVDSFDCQFNGSSVIENTAITAYQNSNVAFGENCISESRLCTSGSLSGSYQFASCQVGAPASCLFDGRTIAHGDSITGFTSSTVPFGQVCSLVAETRTCTNGILSGSALYGSCETNTPRSCLFDGKTILSGDSIIAYQNSSSQYGNTCAQESRTCTDGTLSGAFAYGSCSIDQPASCLFEGRTLAHGESVVAFQASRRSIWLNMHSRIKNM